MIANIFNNLPIIYSRLVLNPYYDLMKTYDSYLEIHHKVDNVIKMS